MVLTADQQQVKALLTDTITLLCKNGLHFRSEFSIEALIGITLDRDDVFLVSINETIKNDKIARDQDSNDFSSKAKSISGTSSAHDRARNTIKCGNIMTSTQSLVEVASYVDNDVVQSLNSPDVKLRFPATEERRRLTIESAATVKEKRFDDTTQSFSDDGFKNESDAGASLERRISEDLPPPKRLRTCVSTTSGEPSVAAVDADAENVNFSKVCKTEPFDVVEIPDDELDDSFQLDDSYATYVSSMYGNGAAVGADESAYCDSYGSGRLQMSQRRSMPGCSSWNSGQRDNELQQEIDDKVELVPGSSVFLSAELFHELEHEFYPKASRLVRRLVHEIFPDVQTLASSSCLGIRRTGGPGLDQSKLDAIREYARLRYPDMSNEEFVRVINSMCCGARRLLRNRRKRFNENWNSSSVDDF